MNGKLGLQQRLSEEATNSKGEKIPSDMDLLEVLFTVMTQVGSDFTNTFRALSKLDLPWLSTYDNSRDVVLTELMKQASSRTDMVLKYETFMELPMVQMRIILYRNFPQQMEDDKLSKSIMKKIEHYEYLKEISDHDWHDHCRQRLDGFLEVYSDRLRYDTENLEKDPENCEKVNENRRKSMNSINPRIVLRNHLAEDAIKAAEKDDFTVVRELLSALEKPYSDDEDLDKFTELPSSTCHLRVSCSS